MTLQELAKAVREEFSLNTRTDGTGYWTRDDKPGGYGDWITKLCFDAHGDILPDDFVYEFIVDALDVLSEDEDTDDARDNLPEEWRTHKIIEWFASHGDRQARADEKLEELMPCGDRNTGVMTILSWAMNEEQQEVFNSVLSSLQEHLDTLPDDDDNESE